MILEEPAASSPNITYSVKIINPAKKTDYSLRKFRVSTHFKTVCSLKKALSEYFPTFLTGDASDVEVGYITPGHGARGKQLWISDDIDIEDMYKEYQGKKEITLWVYTSKKPNDLPKKGKKRTHSPGEAHSKQARTATHTEKMEEVEKILMELKEKHTGTYTEEKLRAWAHLIQMEKHTSYTYPPDMPYFKRGKGTDKSSDSTVQTSAGMSPCKRLTMRTACIEQLDKWHSLLEKGGITQQQYDQLQKKIMSDMLSM